MAFNVGITSKQAFKELRKLTPQRRMETVRGQDGASWLSMLTPTQFAELFPKYYQAKLPDVGGFRDAVSRMSRQKQDDINFGLAQGAKSLEEAEQMGGWRRRLGGGGGGGRATSSGAYSTSVGGGVGAGYEKAGASKREIAEYIRAAAAKRGIDPNIAVRVALSEGLNTYIGDKGSSFGPFQLHYGGIASGGNAGSGEGDLFTRKTGLDARDPSTWRQQIDFSLDRAKVNGWGAWHGAARVGIGSREGLDIQPFTYTPKTMSGQGGTAPSGSAPNFGQYAMYQGINSYHGDCGKGTRRLAGHMFGNNYFFDRGIGSGSNMYAGSLSSGNSYFQNSGLYKSGRPIGRDNLSQDYLNSLPIGTVISSQGGSNGGHVQIKIGPNQWASDTVQSGFYYGNGYSNFVIHEPNDTGMAILSKNGVVQPGGGQFAAGTAVETAPVAQVAPEQTSAPAAPAPKQPEIPPEVPDAPEQNPAKTASVNKPEAKQKETGPKSFNINRQELINAIKQTDEFKGTFGSSLASDNMIYSGFFNDERTKKLMADTNSSFDPSTGQVKIGNYEKFKSAIGMDTSKILTEVASNVPSHAGGGREKVKGPIHMQHLHKSRRGDTALVTDARGKKFTVNPQKENISVNKNTGVMDIKPKKSNEQMDIEKIMALIRRKETGSFEGDYTKDLAAKKRKEGERKDTASGAYQYNDKTWRGVLEKELNMPQIAEQYPRAIAAPKDVQDQVTKARIEKFRSQGRTDDEIILKHFTGNFEGKISARAQKGNPTPAQYQREIASYKLEYDNRIKPEAVAAADTTAPTASPAPTQQSNSLTDRLKSIVSPLTGQPAAAAPKKEESPISGSGSVDFTPPGVDQTAMQPVTPQPKATPTSMIPEKAQTPVSISPMDQRPAHMMPTPSMARAMDTAAGKSDIKYQFGTTLGSQ